MSATLSPIERAAPRGFFVAVALSIAAHVLLLALPLHPHLRITTAAAPAPMRVELVEREPAAPAEPAPPIEPMPPVRETAKVEHLLPLPRMPRLTHAVPEALADAPRSERPPPPPASRRVPLFDMAAVIEARRERRRAMEAAALVARGPSKMLTPEDMATASLNRNLRSLTRDDGVGGVFQILSKGTRDAEFAFNGWRADRPRHWREVIEVQAAPGEDIELAIVRRMIKLIRTHYTGDFEWQSYRLDRVIVLSARPEDNDELEDFLVREFFGTPTLRRARK